MGCCCSNNSEASLLGLVDPSGTVEALHSHEDTLKALHLLAEALEKRRTAVTLMVIGGCISVLLLNQRSHTADVDFLAAEFEGTPFSIKEMLQLADEIGVKEGIGSGWINNRASVWVASDLWEELWREAKDQNIIIFNEHGLKLLVAPWTFAIASKFSRLAGGDAEEG